MDLKELFNSPGVAALAFGAVLAWVLLMFAIGTWIGSRLYGWWDRRHALRLDFRDTTPVPSPLSEIERRMELRHQLREMEEQIREERLSEEEREWRRRYREERAEVKREARRRLGLPEEEPHS